MGQSQDVPRPPHERVVSANVAPLNGNLRQNGYDNVPALGSFPDSLSKVHGLKLKAPGNNKRQTAEPLKQSRPNGTDQPFYVPYAVNMNLHTGRPLYYQMGVPQASTVVSGRERVDAAQMGSRYNGHYDGVGVGYLHHKGRPLYKRDGNQNSSSRADNSVVISTYPDPHDDKVRTGRTLHTVRSEDVTRDAVVVQEASSNNNNNDDNADNKNVSSSGIVVGGETIVPQALSKAPTITSSSGILPNQSRASQYVTYIKDAPPPPTPPPEVQKEAVVVEEHVVTSTATSDVVSRLSDKFIEVGEADGEVNKFLVDGGDQTRLWTEELALSGERLSVEKMPVAEAGLEEQLATVEFAEFSRVDLVMCFDADGAELASRIRNQVEAAGVTVWSGALYDGITDEDLADIVRAIFSAHMTIVLLTESCVQRQQFRDLVSLAKVVNHFIYPVAVDSRQTVEDKMKSDLKLQLSCLKWAYVTREGMPCDEDIQELVQSVKDEFEALRSKDIVDEDYGQVSSWAVRHQQVLRYTTRRKNTTERSVRFADERTEVIEERPEDAEPKREVIVEEVLTAAQFWDQIFPQDMRVPWDKFRAELRSHYLEEITETLPRTCMPRVMESLREGLVEGGNATRSRLVAFCTDRGEDQDVWKRISDLAREHQAVMDVFHQDSTIRIAAIEGIGPFGSPSVVSALREQIQRDSDPAVRYACTVSLSRCMLSGDQASLTALMAALDDQDWTVRRAACQGVARLGVTKAMDRLRRLWRNDSSVHVRNAASLALAQVSGGNAPLRK